MISTAYCGALMTNQRFEPEDLIALDRRGRLDAQQADQLERLYCEDPRTAELYRWGRAFDVEDLVRPGDELLVSRSVDRALRVRTSLKRQKKPRLYGWWLLAGILVGSSAAAVGMVGVVGLLGVQTPSTSPAAPVAALGPSSARAVRGNSDARKLQSAPAVASNELTNPPSLVAGDSDQASAAPTCETLGVVQPGCEPAPPHEPMPAVTPRDIGKPAQSTQKRQPATEVSAFTTSSGDAERRADTAEHPSGASEPHANTSTPSNTSEFHALAAADLFRAAHEARREGNLGLCIRRYRELQQRFATSAEAQESHVSLGKVLQVSGDVAGAVGEFSLYLQHPGALEEEALVGLAEALGQLGRNAQAQSTWQRLLDRYPTSVYAARARKRLAEK